MINMRVNARKDTEDEHIGECAQSEKRWLVQENDGFVGQKGRIVQKTAGMMFFLN